MSESTGTREAEKTLFRRFVDWFIGIKAPVLMDDSGFKLLDNGRWSIWYSNNYADDEGEIFPAAKIDEFIANVKAGVYPYPTLQYAHLSGTDHGKADGLWRVGNFVLATGTFDDNPQAAKWVDYRDSLQKNGRKIGISHRYWYSEKAMQGSAYGSFQTFEISWFPVVGKVKPANPFTSMEVKTMPVKITAELREDMKKLGGFSDAEIDSLEATAQQLDERAIAERRAAKIEGSEETPVTEETKPTPVVEEKPAPVPEPEKPAVPVVDEAAIKKAVDEADAKWQLAFKTIQDANAKQIETLTAAITDLTKKVNDGFALKQPASKSVWTIAKDDDADVQDMKAAETDAKKGKKKSVVEMMAGVNGHEEME